LRQGFDNGRVGFWGDLRGQQRPTRSSAAAPEISSCGEGGTNDASVFSPLSSPKPTDIAPAFSV
jgi:hypothetical protein